MSQATKVLDDLKIQAIMFDMDIDIEALRLQPKNNYKEAFWLTRWKEQQNGADFDNRLDADQE